MRTRPGIARRFKLHEASLGLPRKRGYDTYRHQRVRRIGRLALRAAWGRDDLSIVHINEFKGGPPPPRIFWNSTACMEGGESASKRADDCLYVENHRIAFTSASQPGDVPWEVSAVDLVLECSGKMLTPETLQPYFARGVKKVIVAAPVKQGALNIVMGVNDHLYNPQVHNIVTAASCTTNCLAPIVKVIHQGLGHSPRSGHHH